MVYGTILSVWYASTFHLSALLHRNRALFHRLCVTRLIQFLSCFVVDWLLPSSTANICHMILQFELEKFEWQTEIFSVVNSSESGRNFEVIFSFKCWSRFLQHEPMDYTSSEGPFSSWILRLLSASHTQKCLFWTEQMKQTHASVVLYLLFVHGIAHFACLVLMFSWMFFWPCLFFLFKQLFSFINHFYSNSSILQYGYNNFVVTIFHCYLECKQVYVNCQWPMTDITFTCNAVSKKQYFEKIWIIAETRKNTYEFSKLAITLRIA